jgi:hypothetical protein
MRPLPPKALAPMIALRPLPGSPGYDGDDRAIVDQAVSDAIRYRAAGADAVVLENSHDLPYIKPPLPAAALAAVRRAARAVRREFSGPIGLQLLEAANLSALEIAASCDLDFVRVEGYVFAHVGGAGLIEGCAGELLRLRKKLGATSVRVLADVKKKHCAHALTGDLDIVDVVKQSEFFLADGVIVTGPRTGEAPDTRELRRVRRAAHGVVAIGSGLTPRNIAAFLPLADLFIVGSTLRTGGDFLGALDPARLKEFVTAFRQARG